MKEYEKKIAELETLMLKDDEASAKRRDEIAMWFRTHRSSEAVAAFQVFLKNGFESIEAELREISRKVAESNNRPNTVTYVSQKPFHQASAASV